MSNRPRRDHRRPNYANDRIEYPYDQGDIDLFMERVPIDEDTAKEYLGRHSNVSNAIIQYFVDQDGIEDADDGVDDYDGYDGDYAMVGVEEQVSVVGRDGDDADDGVVDAAPEPVAATVGKN